MFNRFASLLMALVRAVLTLTWLSFTSAHAYSQLFDWPTEGWSPTGTGSLPRTYTDVGGRGIDVVISIFPIDHFTNTSNTTPVVDGANGLRSELNFVDNTESATFTFEFFETGTSTPASVYISDLTTKDLDADTYQDAITFAAIPFGGGTSIAPDQIQLDPGTTLITQGNDTVYSQTNIAHDPLDVEGWATATYQSRLIQSFSVNYHSGPDADPDPGQQWMWISSFIFSGPNLSISKTNSATGPVVPGETIDYTITITNDGTENETNIVLDDVLAPGLAYDLQTTVVTGETLGTSITTVAEDDFASGDLTGGSGWTGNWNYVDPSNNDPGQTLITVQGGRLRFQGVSGTDPYVNRVINQDISASTSVSLEFDIDTSGNLEGSDVFEVFASSDGGSNWSLVASYANDVSGPQQIDISTFASSQTAVRFGVLQWVFPNEFFFIDDLEIVADTPVATPVTKDNILGGAFPDLVSGIPPTLITAGDGFDLLPGHSMTVTYSATVEDPTTALAAINVAAVTSDQISFPHFAFTSNAINHSCTGVSGGTLSISQDADDGYWQKGTDAKFGDSEYLLGLDQGNDTDWVGLRFGKINIPAGAEINDVRIEIEAHQTDSGNDPSTRIYAHDVADAPAFGSSVPGPGQRTTTFVDWDEMGNGDDTWNEDIRYQSENVAPILQELLDSYDGLNNAYIAFLLEGTGDAERKGRARESDEGNPASIEISWSCPNDFGDAPASYNDAQHYNVSLGQLFMGAPGDEPDSEPTQSSAAAGAPAEGDDTDGNDDEDGVTFRSPAGTGKSIFSDVVVNNATTSQGYLCAWMDVNESGIFDFSERQCTTIAASSSGTQIFQWSGLSTDAQHTTYARFRLGPLIDQADIESPTNIVLGGEVEDYRIIYDFSPTVVTIGKVELNVEQVTTFLTELGIEQKDKADLLALLTIWDPDLAATMANADRQALLIALYSYLDPDGDGQVAVLGWETLEERGTIGFYAERRQDNIDWKRINDKMLPGLITAPMGGEYKLADPDARSGERYHYQLIEQEARGTTRTYGPFKLEMAQ